MAQVHEIESGPDLIGVLESDVKSVNDISGLPRREFLKYTEALAFALPALNLQRLGFGLENPAENPTVKSILELDIKKETISVYEEEDEDLYHRLTP